MASLGAGSIVDKRFRIVEEVGRGAMGVVYRAEQIGIDREVAIKVLAAGATADQNHIKRFQREAHVVSLLEHPNIVRIFAIGVVDQSGEPYIAMEFLDGESLAGRLQRVGKLAWQDAAQLFMPICDALHYAHQKEIVHRDIKPSNIAICSNEQPKLVDFGIARLTGEDAGKLTRTDVVLGTLCYLSPEQFAGKKATSASDIYSLGCTLFEVLTGTPPYLCDSPFETMNAHLSAPIPSIRERAPDVPPQLEALVAQMMQKSPEERPNSMSEIETTLFAITQGKTGPVQVAPAVKSQRNRKTFPALLAALSVVAGAMSAWWLWQSQPVPEPAIIGPTTYRDYFNQGRSYGEQRKLQLAKRSFEEAKKLAQSDRDKFDVVNNLVSIYYHTGEDHKARNSADETQKLAASLLRPEFEGSLVLIRLNRLGHGLDAARRSLERDLLPREGQLSDNDKISAWQEACLVYAAFGQKKKAEKYLKRLEAMPTKPTLPDLKDMELHALFVRSPRESIAPIKERIASLAENSPKDLDDPGEAISALDNRRKINFLYVDLIKAAPEQEETLGLELQKNQEEFNRIKEYLCRE